MSKSRPKLGVVIHVNFLTGKVERPQRDTGGLPVSWNGPRTKKEWREYFDFCCEEGLDAGELPAWFRG